MQHAHSCARLHAPARLLHLFHAHADVVLHEAGAAQAPLQRPDDLQQAGRRSEATRQQHHLRALGPPRLRHLSRAVLLHLILLAAGVDREVDLPAGLEQELVDGRIHLAHGQGLPAHPILVLSQGGECLQGRQRCRAADRDLVPAAQPGPQLSKQPNQPRRPERGDDPLHGLARRAPMLGVAVLEAVDRHHEHAHKLRCEVFWRKVSHDVHHHTDHRDANGPSASALALAFVGASTALAPLALLPGHLLQHRKDNAFQ
mmetsp:Transcript_122006/g.390091  ORF Transcript_122006/g.390091 Transcript_122006/m.390091 type:complete len:258 (+) Transcript_122006:3634-4407(+)